MGGEAATQSWQGDGGGGRTTHSLSGDGCSLVLDGVALPLKEQVRSLAMRLLDKAGARRAFCQLCLLPSSEEPGCRFARAVW